MGPRKSKKSETLQVRLPYGMKKDFMERVQLENRSASDLIRDFIESYLAGPVEILNSPKVVMIRRRVIYPGLMAAGLVGAVIVFMPNPGAARILQTEFARQDIDKDGFLSAVELTQMSPDTLMMQPSRPGRHLKPGPDGIVMHDAAGKPLRVRTLPLGKTAAEMKAEPGEVLLTREQMKQHLLNYHDVDDDQKLSFEEYRGSRLRGARYLFERADTNFDDRLTEEEYLKSRIPTLNPEFVATLPPERQEAARRNVEPIKARVRTVFQGWDVNKDGFVTRKEMTPA